MHCEKNSDSKSHSSFWYVSPVFVRQFSIHNIREDFHVTVGMSTKSCLRLSTNKSQLVAIAVHDNKTQKNSHRPDCWSYLDKVVVQNAQDSKLFVGGVIVLWKAAQRKNAISLSYFEFKKFKTISKNGSKKNPRMWRYLPKMKAALQPPRGSGNVQALRRNVPHRPKKSAMQ